MSEINLGLANEQLYKGCEIAEAGGRLAIVTEVAEAVNIIGRNAWQIVNDIEDRTSVTLTGPMAIWAYLVVFHVVLHRFNRVYYDDGRGNHVLIAQH